MISETDVQTYKRDGVIVVPEVLDAATLGRVFCKACGTRLFSWRSNGTAAGIALAVFDDRHAFVPTEHIWVSEKMNWVRIDDGLPQYPEGPPPV